MKEGIFTDSNCSINWSYLFIYSFLFTNIPLITWIIRAIPNPTTPPAKIITKHSSNLNRFAVKDYIPAMVAKNETNPKYKVLIVFLFVVETGSIPLRI